MMASRSLSSLTTIVCAVLASLAVATAAQRPVIVPPSRPSTQNLLASGAITVDSLQGSIVIRIKDRGLVTLPSTGGFELKGDDDRRYAIKMDSAGNIVLDGRTVTIKSDREMTLRSTRAMLLDGRQDLTMKAAMRSRIEGGLSASMKTGGSRFEATPAEAKVLAQMVKLN